MPDPPRRRRSSFHELLRLGLFPVVNGAFLSGLSTAAILLAGQLWIARTTQDPFWLSLVYVLGWGTSVLSLFAGAVLDRVERKQAFRVSLALQGALALVLGAALLTGRISLLVLYATLLALRLLALVQSPAVLVPRLVPRASFEQANGLLMTAALASAAVGEALSGSLFDRSAALPFAAAGLAALVGALVLGRLEGEFRPETRRRFRGTDLLGGLRWLLSEPTYRRLIGLRVGSDLLRVSGFSLLALYATEVLQVSGAGYGLIAASFGIGGGLAGLLVAALVRRIGLSWSFRSNLLLDACAFALLAALPHPLLAAFLVAAIGFTTSAWGVLEVSLRQAAAPDHLLGRVGGSMQFLAGLAGMAGALAGGTSGRLLGVVAHYGLIAALLCILGVASLFLIREPELQRLRDGETPKETEV